jgi:hypothetical protein
MHVPHKVGADKVSACMGGLGCWLPNYDEPFRSNEQMAVFRKQGLGPDWLKAGGQPQPTTKEKRRIYNQT